jgi:hypothetical protein
MSRLTMQQTNDQEFFERARKKSPMFPSLDEAMERHRRRRETIIARTYILGMFAGAVYSFWSGAGFAVAGLSFVGFVTTCFYAGNRQYTRHGGPGRNHRPF